jgi:McKusick-Kaufman syndrome protein
MKIDISYMKSMLCLVRSVVGTKPACQLTEDEQELLCTVLLEVSHYNCYTTRIIFVASFVTLIWTIILLLQEEIKLNLNLPTLLYFIWQAFLQSLPTITKDKEPLKLSSSAIQFLYCEGSAVNDTKAVKGVLLEAPDLPTFSKDTPKVKNLKVALYNVSMAGDTDEWFEGVTQVASGEVKQAEMSKGVVEQMKGVALALINAEVGLVACQKCIHPALKRFLKEKVNVVQTNGMVQ